LGASALANFFKSGEIPFAGKIDALLWLHRVDGAAAVLKEKTFSVCLVNQCQALAIGLEPGELLDKIVFGEIQITGQI